MKAGTLSLHLFEAYGVEVEYMVVDRELLAVRPIVDKLFDKTGSAREGEVERGNVTWSNELVRHVIELKTTDPVPTLAGVADDFERSIADINEHLASLDARLMPGGMHPWMDPETETQLWPRGYAEVYSAFDRIFNCRRHGWSNLQSMHLNYPFASDLEFARLHAAIRVLLPILPALAASSPLMDGKTTGTLDNRLQVYRHNSHRLPAIGGRVIPEPVFTAREYRRRILQPIYRDIAPYDREGVLQHEWLNARGAIARFERNTIEIRVLDAQECPSADLAIAQAVTAVLKALVAEEWVPISQLMQWTVEPLDDIFQATVRDAEKTVIHDRAYLDLFGYPPTHRATAGELWNHLMEILGPRHNDRDWATHIEFLLEQGPLARRILRALGPKPDPETVREIYRKLCDCLAHGQLFEA